MLANAKGLHIFGSAVKILSDVKERIVWGAGQPDTFGADEEKDVGGSGLNEGACHAGGSLFDGQRQMTPGPATGRQAVNNDDGSGGSGGGLFRARRPRGPDTGREYSAGTGGVGAAAGGGNEGPVQAYMSLWASSGASTHSLGEQSFAGSSPALTGNTGGGLIGNGRSPRFSGRVARSSSVASLLPISEQRTRRVVLDFFNVVGVDATAGRSCFLMLTIVLRTSGVEVVFSGATRKIQALMRSHGVISDDDPVFNSLDDALEWSEEMMLKERRDEMLLRRMAGGAETVAGISPSLLPHRQRHQQLQQQLQQQPLQRAFGGTAPPPLDLESASPYRKDQHAGDERRSFFRGRADGQGMRSAAEGMPRGQRGQAEDEKDEERPRATTSAEAAAFTRGHENYYVRAETLRRRSTMTGRISNQAAEDEALIVGDVGSLQYILEDYLEVDRYQVPESVRRVLGEAQSYFRDEHVSAGAILATGDRTGAPLSTSSSDKLYFIGAGSVELQIHGEYGPRRLQKICAGGTFGEVGFFLRSPQAFRAVAREPCHLHTLDRKGMAAMQRQNPGLCILVQKALMKSICLAASLSIEKQRLGLIDDGRPERMGEIEEER